LQRTRLLSRGPFSTKNLSDRDVTPIAEILLERGVPVVFQTSVGLPADLIRLQQLRSAIPYWCLMIGAGGAY
jgi:hypothetical protein